MTEENKIIEEVLKNKDLTYCKKSAWWINRMKEVIQKARLQEQKKFDEFVIKLKEELTCHYGCSEGENKRKIIDKLAEEMKKYIPEKKENKTILPRLTKTQKKLLGLKQKRHNYE